MKMEEEREKILEEYSYLDKAELEDFVWEFIRRNKDYQRAYDDYKKNEHKWEEMSLNVKSKEPKRMEWQKYLKGINKFGLKYALDYRMKANDVKMFKQYFNSKSPHFLFWFDDDELCDIEKNEFKFAIAIDTRYPSDKTINEVEAIVKNARKKRPGPKSRRDIENWKNYLMSYDLKEAGFDTKKISEIVFSKKNEKNKQNKGRISKCASQQHHPSDCPFCDSTRKYIKTAKKYVMTPSKLFRP